eukprot:jgi/Astpho2/5729/Aster-02258
MKHVIAEFSRLPGELQGIIWKDVFTLTVLPEIRKVKEGLLPFVEQELQCPFNVLIISLGGGLLQLVSVGSQNVYLNSNPSITFFRSVYRRYTNFATEAIAQTFNGSPGFDRKISAQISRNGDLVTDLILEVTLPALKSSYTGPGTGTGTLTDSSGNDIYVHWVNSVGHAFVKSAEFEVGGQRINFVGSSSDKTYGEVLEIEDETMQTAEKQDGYGRMVGKFDNDSVALEVDPAVAGGYRPVDRPDVPFNKKLIYSGSRDQKNSETALQRLSQKQQCRSDETMEAVSSFSKWRAMQLTRNRVNKVLRRLKFQKPEKTSELLGCHSSILTLWLRFQFGSTMSWSNMGTHWHVDHVIPLRLFDMTDDKQRHIACHWTNTRPVTELVRMYLKNSTSHTIAPYPTDASKIQDMTGSVPQCNINLYATYVYLSQEERKRMAQTASEFLITQTQFTGAETYNATTAGTAENKIRLNLNHPVKALYWTIMKDSSEHVGPAFGLPFAWGEQIFSDPAQPVGQDLMTGGKLVLNGHDRFSPRKGSYFRLVEPYYAHVRIPRRHVYVYSFALKAGEHQPSGTCNFSRIDNAFFNIVLAPSPTTTPVPRTIAFYGKNYNVFRVISGMGGLHMLGQKAVCQDNVLRNQLCSMSESQQLVMLCIARYLVAGKPLEPVIPRTMTVSPAEVVAATAFRGLPYAFVSSTPFCNTQIEVVKLILRS